MSNHYHLVLHVDHDRANSWSDDEVIKRWTASFPRNGLLIETLYRNQKARVAKKQLRQHVELWRERLMDISWFMRCLNEPIARQANREDDCKGRFWEGRFKSQALLDEKALLTCMAYVDLNPIRAGVSESLDSSDFTSIQERLISHAKKARNRSYRQRRLLTRRSVKHLTGHHNSKKKYDLKLRHKLQIFSRSILPVTQQNYFELLETTSKVLGFRQTKRATAIRLLKKNQNALEGIEITSAAWLDSVNTFHRHYSAAAGSESSLVHFHRNRIKAGVNFKHPHKWIRGARAARQLYGT